MADKKFSVIITLMGENGELVNVNSEFVFFKGNSGYGNDMGMAVNIAGLWEQHDLRYNTNFDLNNMDGFIMDFLSERYTGENGSWELHCAEINEEV